MIDRSRFIASLLLLVCMAGCERTLPPEPTAAQLLRSQPIKIGETTVQLEVARTQVETQTGLMFRPTLAADAGMLFDFNRQYTYCFWMKNTLIPLSAAFVDAGGQVVNIEDMQPQTENNHCAQRPVRYVLEMNQGWFATHKVKPGDRLDFTKISY